MALAWVPAAMQAQTTLALETNGELKAALALAGDPTLTPQVLADIATYLNALPVAGRLGQGPGSDLARGQALFEKDCAGCHGAQGEGQAELFHPVVAAQHDSYLLRELGMIRDGSRGNSNPTMRTVVQGYAPADLQAVADHLSRLPPPK